MNTNPGSHRKARYRDRIPHRNRQRRIMAQARNGTISLLSLFEGKLTRRYTRIEPACGWNRRSYACRTTTSYQILKRRQCGSREKNDYLKVDLYNP